MEFKIFAKKLKNVIGGKSNTKIFTKTIFEAMMNDSGPELLADTSLDTFKAYFNGNTSISTEKPFRHFRYLKPLSVMEILKDRMTLHMQTVILSMPTVHRHRAL